MARLVDLGLFAKRMQLLLGSQMLQVVAPIKPTWFATTWDSPVWLPKAEHVALSVAIVATVERDVVPPALRVIISMVVGEVFHLYRQLSIGYAVIQSLSHQVWTIAAADEND